MATTPTPHNAAVEGQIVGFVNCVILCMGFGTTLPWTCWLTPFRDMFGYATAPLRDNKSPLVGSGMDMYRLLFL